jgi:hypothetical protein
MGSRRAGTDTPDPSLRAKRSNPEVAKETGLLRQELLAMT